MKAFYQYRQELEAAQHEATEAYLRKLYDEAFQRGVERGRFEQRMDARKDLGIKPEKTA